MKVNQKGILDSLKADLKSAEQLKTELDSKIQEWRDAYDGKPYGNEQEGKSTIISRDIKRQSEWQHASLVDPFVSTSDVIKCHPITAEDREAARQSELLLNTQFCRKFNRFNFMSKAIKILDMEGTVVVQTGWDYEDEPILIESETVTQDEFGNEVVVIEQVEDIRVVRNQPTATICRNEDIYLDPTCMDDIDKAQFIIHRYETDLSTLRKDGRYKNLDRVAKSSIDEDFDFDSEDTTGFRFKDEPRKKIVVYEYWGNFDIDDDGIAEPIVCAWVGDTIIRLSSNPFPDGKPPFLVVPFNSIPFKIHGEANAELIGDNQKVKTAIYRGVLDNMAQSTNGQVGMRKLALDNINRARFLKGKHFEFNGASSDIWQGSYNAIPNSVFDVLGLMNSEIESLTGTKSFSSGITGASLGNVATAVRGTLDATAARRMHIVRNVAENLVKPLMRKWLSYNNEFLEEQEVVRITNENFVPIRRDDLDGNIDIDITVATAEDNAARSQELSFLLQTLGPNEDPMIRRHIMADIMELMRMPDRALFLRSYQDEPDPFIQQMQEIELAKAQKELELLDAKIAVEQAIATGKPFDYQLVQSRAMAEQSRARKLDSDADNADLQFLMTEEGVSHQNKLELLEKQRLGNLDVASLKAMSDNVNRRYKK